jgi:gamma-glutamylcyclotransferase (GGCT)/AIG2-like uncharacterized protein YtfP
MPEAQLFFVYGTLRRGDDNDITRLLPAPKFIGHANIAGTMYHLGGYPGVTLGGAGQIVGEVYSVSDELEKKLDAIESEYPAQPDEYFKRQIKVFFEDVITNYTQRVPRFSQRRHSPDFVLFQKSDLFFEFANPVKLIAYMYFCPPKQAAYFTIGFVLFCLISEH